MINESFMYLLNVEIRFNDISWNSSSVQLDYFYKTSFEEKEHVISLLMENGWIANQTH